MREIERKFENVSEREDRDKVVEKVYVRGSRKYCGRMAELVLSECVRVRQSEREGECVNGMLQ